MKRQNNGIIEYQKNKRNDTMSRIDEAYEYLSTTHQPISKSSLSRESGISRVTLNKPEITEYLKKYPEFCLTNESSSIIESNQHGEKPARTLPRIVHPAPPPTNLK
ncbi:MAG: hypothetical protein V8R96_06065 [Gemmiger sp.]